MHVVFRHVGQVEVHDVRQLDDVQAARGDVGRHQHLQAAGLELGQRARASVLALVAVDRQRRDAVLRQLLGQPVRAVLGARKHQHLEPVVLAHQVRQQLALARLVDRQHALADRVGRRVAARDFDQRRLVQQAVGQCLDLVGERRREQQVLALRRQQLQHATNVVDEAHVEHAIGLVEHQYLHARQVDRALAGVVEQAARGRDQDVHPATQAVDLRVDVDAAEHDGRRDLQVLRVGDDAFLDLRRELARRREDQHADRARASCGRLARRRRRQALQDRQHEAGGLSGAGLRAGEQVTAGQHGRNGFRLDGGGGIVAAFGDGTDEGFGQAQGSKRHETPATSASVTAARSGAAGCDASRGQTNQG